MADCVRVGYVEQYVGGCCVCVCVCLCLLICWFASWEMNPELPSEILDAITTSLVDISGHIVHWSTRRLHVCLSWVFDVIDRT